MEKSANKTLLFTLATLVVILTIVGVFLMRSGGEKMSDGGVNLTNNASMETVKFSENGMSESKTYQSKKVGIEIQYPSTWEVIELDDPKAGFALRSPDYEPIQSGVVTFSGEIYVNSHENPNGLSIEQLYSTFTDTSASWFKEHFHQDITIGNYSGVEFPHLQEKDPNYPDGKHPIVSRKVAVHVNNTVIFFSYLFTGSKNEEVIEVMDNIMADFHPL